MIQYSKPMVSAKPYFEEPTPVYDTLDVSVHHVPVNFAEAEAETGANQIARWRR